MDGYRTTVLSGWYSRYVAAVGVIAAAAIAPLATTQAAPPVAPVLILGALLCFAENADLRLPSGASMSGGFVVAMAAILVFHHDGALGAMLVGLFAGLYLPNVRAGEWRKVTFNSSTYALAMGLGVVVLSAIPASWPHSTGLLLVAALPTGVAWFAVNVCLVSLAVALYERARPSAVLRSLLEWHWHIYPFAVLGVFLGRLYLDVGPTIVVLVVTPVLAARGTFASYARVREAHEAALRTLVLALESKDPYTAGHVERVATYADYIAEELGLRPAARRRVHAAALMHDIGKLAIPNQLLNKPDRLTAFEYERVRRHEEVTFEILRRIDLLRPISPSITARQPRVERAWPRTAIEPCVIAVADAYDAMTSTRAYRRALPREVAFRELRDNVGTQFDQRCVDALIHAVGQRDQDGDSVWVDIDEQLWSVMPPVMGPGSAGLGDLADAPAR